jgi:PhnB protein
MKLIPYLLPINAKKAISYYEKLFNAKLIDHEKFNPKMGKQFGFAEDFDYENSTMHATIEINGSTVYLADSNKPKVRARNTEIVLELESEDEINTFYKNAIKYDCEILMPLEKTFWGAFYTRFVDKFGIGWQLNYTIDQTDQ